MQTLPEGIGTELIGLWTCLSVFGCNFGYFSRLRVFPSSAKILFSVMCCRFFGRRSFVSSILSRDIPTYKKGYDIWGHAASETHLNAFCESARRTLRSISPVDSFYASIVIGAQSRRQIILRYSSKKSFASFTCFSAVMNSSWNIAADDAQLVVAKKLFFSSLHRVALA